MKKLTLVALAALLAATTAQAGWWQTFGGEGSEGGHCVQITSDDNYIICGTKGDSLWLLKVDTSGNLIWAKTHGGGDRMKGKWVEETNDGRFIVATRSPSLVKTDAEGDTLWSKDLGMYSYCVQETSDYGYIVVGGDNGWGYDEQLVLVKTNSDGDTLWTRTHAELGHNINSASFIQVTDDNGYIITGTTGIESEEFATRYLWLVKTDADGNVQWTRKFGTGGNSEFNSGNCVTQTKNGEYIVTGDTNTGSGLWLLKTNSQGDILWSKVYSSASGGEGNSIQETEDGYIVVGTTDAVYLSASSPASRKLWLLKTDSQGDTSWTKIYGGDDQENGKSVQQTSDLGYIVAGYTSSFGTGGSDVYLLKTDSLGLLGVAEKPIPESLNWGMVSSLGSSIVLHYADCPSGLQISVFDVCGRNIDAINVTGQSGTLTLGEDYPSGVYFIQSTNNNQTRTARVVLIY